MVRSVNKFLVLGILICICTLGNVVNVYADGVYIWEVKTSGTQYNKWTQYIPWLQNSTTVPADYYYSGTPVGIAIGNGITYLATTNGIYYWEVKTSGTQYRKWTPYTPWIQSGTIPVDYYYNGTPVSIAVYNGTPYIATTSGVYRWEISSSYKRWTPYTPWRQGSATPPADYYYNGIPTGITIYNGIPYITTTNGVYYWEVNTTGTDYNKWTMPYTPWRQGSATPPADYYYSGTPVGLTIYNGVPYIATTNGVYYWEVNTAGTDYSKWTMPYTPWRQGSTTPPADYYYSGTPVGLTMYNGVPYIATTNGVYYWEVNTAGTDYNRWTPYTPWIQSGTIPTDYYYSGTPASIVMNGDKPLIAAGTPYNAEIVSNTFSNTMERGTTTSVSVSVKNTGSRIWSEAEAYRLGAVGDSDPFAGGRQYIQLGQNVLPNQEYTFTFNLTAPNIAGSYISDWRMVRDGVTWFGGSFSKNITVTNPTPPTGTIKINDDNQYTNVRNLSISLTTWDDITPQEKLKVYISFNPTLPASPTWLDYSANKSITYTGADGNVTVYAWLKDTSNLVSVRFSDTIIFDNTPPTGTIKINNGETSTDKAIADLNFTKIFQDANVNQIIISNNSNFSVSETFNYADTINYWPLDTSTASSTKTVYAKYLDWAGNYSDVINASIEYIAQGEEGNIPSDDEYSTILGYKDEKMASVDGFSFMGSSEYNNNKYLFFKSSSAIIVTDLSGNQMSRKNVGSGFEYLGSSQGKIVYKRGDSYYFSPFRDNNSYLISASPGYTGYFSSEGMLVFVNYGRVLVSANTYEVNYDIYSYDVNTNSLLYHRQGSVPSYQTSWAFTFSVNGWTAVMTSSENDGNRSGNSYYFSKVGNLYGPYSWSVGSGDDVDIRTSPFGLVICDYNDSSSDYAYFYTTYGDVRQSYNYDYGFWTNTKNWFGDATRYLQKSNGINKGSLYSISWDGEGKPIDSVKELSEDYMLFIISGYYERINSPMLGLALFKADHASKSFTQVWSTVGQADSYPDLSAVADIENKLLYLYKTNLGTDSTEVSILNITDGSVLVSGLFPSIKSYEMFSAFDNNLYIKKNDAIYKRNFVYADSSINDGNQIINVVDGMNFDVLVEETFTGEYKNSNSTIVVTATNKTGEEFTNLKGKFDIKVQTPKVFKITIENHTFNFRVLPPPSSSTITDVTFE